jgi:hypothetical protein
VRLLWGAVAARLGESLALLLLAVLAIAAGVATPLYADAADRRAIEAELAAATPVERAITLQTPVFEGHTELVLQQLQARARAVLHQPTLTEVTGAWADGIAGVPLVARSEVCAHLSFDGECANDAGEVLAATGPIGRTITQGQLTLRVVGVYRPEGAARDPYWAGRAALTPLPRRATNPLFTPISTFADPELTSAQATYDLVAGPGSLTPQSLSSLAAQLRTGPDFGIQVQSQVGLRSLVERIGRARAELAASLPLGAVESLLLCWFVLLLTITYGTVRRRAESGLAALRGAPGRYRWMLVLGPAVAVLLLAAPLGLGLGWLVALLAGGTGSLTPLALASGAATLLAVLVTSAIAAWRAQKVTLLDALRQVPSRSPRGVMLTEAVVVVVALAGVIQALVQRGSGLALIAPIGAAVVTGLLVARLVRYAASVSGSALLARGRLGPGLAALQLARRPGADRLVALMVVTVALAGHAVSAWDASLVRAQREAVAELGAARVLSGDGRVPHRPADRGAKGRPRRALGHGRGAVRQRQRRCRGRGFDAPGRGHRAERHGTTPAPHHLRPRSRHGQPAGARLRRPGAAARADARHRRFGRPARRARQGDGRHPFRVRPALARGRAARVRGAPGCRLAWLSFGRSPNGIWVSRVGDLTGTALSVAARWRKSLDAGADTTILMRPGEVGVHYAPTDVRVRSNDIRLSVADAPLPLPRSPPARRTSSTMDC